MRGEMFRDRWPANNALYDVLGMPIYGQSSANNREKVFCGKGRRFRAFKHDGVACHECGDDRVKEVVKLTVVISSLEQIQ